MHIVLVGPGALGCLLAARLTRGNDAGGFRFTLLDHNAARANTLASEGLIYRFKDRLERSSLTVSSSPGEIGTADAILVCVKSYDIPDCLGFCSPLLGPETLLLFMQNGVAHLEVAIPAEHGTPAYGTTTEGATLVGPGQVLHAGKGLTQFGFLGEVAAIAGQRLMQITELFNASDLKARISEDILSRLWTKLMVNTGINGLTATLGCTNGELLTLPGAAERMALLVEEARQVADASGIDVPADSLAITREVCLKTATNISSMFQDVRAGRRTEIDAINGAIVAAGRKHGVPTPENSRLVKEIKDLERSYLNQVES